MIGWLLDTNVVAELANPHGAARVQAWAAAQDERRLYLSILTFSEHDKGLHNLPKDSAAWPRIEAVLAALEARLAGRLLPVTDAVVRRWGAISGVMPPAKGSKDRGWTQAAEVVAGTGCARRSGRHNPDRSLGRVPICERVRAVTWRPSQSTPFWRKRARRMALDRTTPDADRDRS